MPLDHAPPQDLTFHNHVFKHWCTHFNGVFFLMCGFKTDIEYSCCHI
jgi:hypothetical protein